MGVTIVEGEESRYATPEAMLNAWSGAGYVNTPLLTMDDLALLLKKNTSDTCLVTGSLYFLGHLLKKLNIHCQQC